MAFGRPYGGFQSLYPGGDALGGFVGSMSDLIPDAGPAPAQAAPAMSPAPGGARPVQTIPISRQVQGAFQEAPQAPQGAQPPQQAKVADDDLMAFYKSQISKLSGDGKKESGRERLARMLINFGSGAFKSASNIRGRKVGPGLAESIGGGAVSLGEGELAEKDRRAGRATKRGNRAVSLTEKMMKLERDTRKEDETRKQRSFDNWIKQRRLQHTLKGGSNKMADYLLGRVAPRLIAQGDVPPEQLVPQIAAIMEQIRANPALAAQFGLSDSDDF